MINLRKSALGLYYLIVGAIFAIVIWPFGEEFIRGVIFLLGISLIINGAIFIFLYRNLSKLNYENSNWYLVDGIIRIVFGLVVIFIPLGVISTILGILLLCYTIMIAIVNKKVKDLWGKSIYKIILALILIFCGIDKVGLWILRFIDLLIIIYGLLLLLLSDGSSKKTDEQIFDSTSKLIDVEFEESKEDE